MRNREEEQRENWRVIKRARRAEETEGKGGSACRRVRK